MRSQISISVPSKAILLCFADIRSMGHDNKMDLVEEVLNLMAREKHSPEVSEAGRRHGHQLMLFWLTRQISTHFDVYSFSTNRRPAAIVRVCRFRSLLQRVPWISRVCLMATDNPVWNGASPPSPTSPPCCSEPTRPNRPGERDERVLCIYSVHLWRCYCGVWLCRSQMLLKWKVSDFLSSLSSLVREMLQLFKSKNRVPP